MFFQAGGHNGKERLNIVDGWVGDERMESSKANNGINGRKLQHLGEPDGTTVPVCDAL